MTITSISGGGHHVYQGQAKTGADYASKDVNGVKMKFQQVDQQKERHVCIDGASLGQPGKDLHLQLKPGLDTIIDTDNGHRIRALSWQLIVDGNQVFDNKGRPATGKADGTSKAAPESPTKALAALEKRFPGVTFDGDINAAGLVKIGPDVKIKKGARIELSPDLEIRGKCRIGADARISGAKIRDSDIDGVVTGGKLERSVVEKGGIVRGGDLTFSAVNRGGAVKGGKLNDCAVNEGGAVTGGELTKCVINDAKVSGGVLEKTKVLGGAEVSGGLLDNMRIDKGSKVSGGVFEDFKLLDRDVGGGIHCGAYNPLWNDKTKQNERTDAFSPHVQETVMNPQQYQVPPGMYGMDYQGMNQAYDPNMMGYPQQHMGNYGGHQMPPGMMGYPGMPGMGAGYAGMGMPGMGMAPGIVAPGGGFGGMGTGMMAGLAAGGLLGLGMGAFGGGMFGLGMGTMGLGWGMGGLGMMGMGGLGMMGMGGMGMGMGMCW